MKRTVLLLGLLLLLISLQLKQVSPALAICDPDCGYTIPCDSSWCDTCHSCPPPEPPPQAPTGIYNPALHPSVGSGSGIDIISTLLRNALAIALIVGTLVFFAFLIFGAIQWITAGGDKAKTESASKKITTAIVGLVILFSVFAIMKLIGSFFGISALQSLFFNLSPFFFD
jgi:hypothetical protein